jgi:cysteine-rich repeat protein
MGGAEGTGGGGGMGGAPPPLPVCGDGNKEGAEGCDDSNTTPGDGCGPTCVVEDPKNCPGTPITLGVSTLIISDNTGVGADNAKDTPSLGNCNANTWPGKDLVYAVTPTQAGTLTATMKTEYDANLLHVRKQCPGGVADEMACHYETSKNNSNTVSVSVMAGETYYVFPDSYASQSGKFTLTLQLQ